MFSTYIVGEVSDRKISNSILEASKNDKGSDLIFEESGHIE